MTWLIKSKGRAIRLRDGVGPDAPMYDLSDGKWHPFEHLPIGMSNGGDGDVDVKEQDSGSYDAAPVVSKSAPKAKDPQAEVKPAEPPKKHKARFR